MTESYHITDYCPEQQKEGKEEPRARAPVNMFKFMLLLCQLNAYAWISVGFKDTSDLLFCYLPKLYLPKPRREFIQQPSEYESAQHE